MKFLGILASMMLLSGAVYAAPPEIGSEDYKLMLPLKEWVGSQHDTLGRWCCNIEDGRPVEARIDGDHWIAHVTPQKFKAEKDHWISVPDEKVTRGGNPTGTPFLWLYEGRVQCFAPPDGA